MAEGLAIVAVVVIAGGYAWCRRWPRERDRFAHTVYAWIALAVLLAGAAAAKFY